MKLLIKIVNVIVTMLLISFCSIFATFFISIFKFEAVVKSLEFFKNFF